jgi:lactoylglutathione lyase
MHGRTNVRPHPYSSQKNPGGKTVFTDLAHIALRTHDLERCLSFYALLGIHEAFRLHHPDGSPMLVYLHVAADRFIEVFPGGTNTPTPEKNFMHLCLRSSDLKADVLALEAKGIPLHSAPKLGLDGNLQAWIQDPDGNMLELMQLSEDSPQRRVARGETTFSE